MSKNKIGIKELAIICLSLCFTAFPAFGTSYILNNSQNSSIISVVIGTIIGIVPLLMIIYISKFTNSKTIFTVNKEKFKLFGDILNIMYVLGILFWGFIVSWEILNFTISELLTRTSYYAVAIVLFLIIGYGVTKGYEIVGRTSLILGIIGIAIFTFIVLFLIPKIEINNLYPIFNVSTKSIIKTSLVIPTISVYPLITILCIKKQDIENNKNYSKALFFGYGLGILIEIILLFLIISIYGIDLARLFSYPEYYLYKKVNAFEFISRIENIGSITIYISFFANICTSILFVKNFFQEKFKIKKEKKLNILVYVLALLVPLLSIYFFKNYQVFYLIKYYPLIASIILVALAINFILLLFKKKDLKNES